MQTYVILRRGGWKDSQALEEAAGVSTRIADDEMSDQVKWIRSYVLAEEDGTLGTVCIYQATDEAAIQEHADRADLPADEIIEVADTVIIRDDP